MGWGVGGKGDRVTVMQRPGTRELRCVLPPAVGKGLPEVGERIYAWRSVL